MTVHSALTEGQAQLLADIANSVGGSGVIANVSFTPAAGAYSALDIMDVAKALSFTFADGVTSVPAGSLLRLISGIIKIDQTALQSSEGAYSLALYSATPPSAQADNAAWSLASADLSVYRGTISLGTPVDLGAACYIKTQLSDQQDIHMPNASLYAELITVAGFTPTAVARQIFLYGFLV